MPKIALFGSEMVCFSLKCIKCYLTVLYGIALYLIASYGIYYVTLWYCIVSCQLCINIALRFTKLDLFTLLASSNGLCLARSLYIYHSIHVFGDELYLEMQRRRWRNLKFMTLVQDLIVEPLTLSN